MRSATIIAALIGLAASPAIAAPALVPRYSPFPLADGFPSPSASELQTIESLAGGTLSDGPPPASLSATSLNTLRLIAFNEIFEVAYFTELLQNITSGEPGYTDFGVFSQEYVVDALTTVINQEELHALSANGALAAFNAGPILPCQYSFPVSSYDDAVALAATFTDVVLGTLQAAQFAFATDGDAGLVPFIGSVIGQEGEQNGFYRIVQEKVPSSSPFLTASAPPFAFTALQSFVIPGSCPNIETIDVPTLLPLAIIQLDPAPVDQTLVFMVSGTPNLEGMYVAYISGQNVPVVVPIYGIEECEGYTTFCAFLPFQGGPAMFSNGLTIAAVTTGMGPFADASAVAAAAVYGPGLIEID